MTFAEAWVSQFLGHPSDDFLRYHHLFESHSSQIEAHPASTSPAVGMRRPAVMPDR